MKKRFISFVRIGTFLAISLLTVHALGQDRHYSKAPTNQLIDELTEIDSESPGITSMAIYDAFIADGSAGSFKVGVLGVPPPKVPPQMRELVRRGPLVLPELLRHLDDPRPTKLKVGNPEAENPHKVAGDDRGFFMWEEFSDEYDPAVQYLPGGRPKSMEKRFEGAYTVKVGDVCYVIVGQIVNRWLFAVRYQPTGGLIVNSPIEAPLLAKRVRDDWSNVDAAGLKASLLVDVKNPDRREAALKRLKLYFPDAYNVLHNSSDK